MRDRVLKRRMEQTFGKVPYVLMAADPPLSSHARAVFAALDWHGRAAFPSSHTIALMSGCSERQVFRALRELIKGHFIKRAGGGVGRPVVYEINQAPEQVKWKPLTDRQRVRHEKESTSATQADPPLPHRQTPPQTSATQADYRTPTPLSNVVRSNSSPDAGARERGQSGKRRKPAWLMSDAEWAAARDGRGYEASPPKEAP